MHATIKIWSNEALEEHVSMLRETPDNAMKEKAVSKTSRKMLDQIFTHIVQFVVLKIMLLRNAVH